MNIDRFVAQIPDPYDDGLAKIDVTGPMIILSHPNLPPLAYDLETAEFEPILWQ